MLPPLPSRAIQRRFQQRPGPFMITWRKGKRRGYPTNQRWNWLYSQGNLNTSKHYLFVGSCWKHRVLHGLEWKHRLFIQFLWNPYFSGRNVENPYIFIRRKPVKKMKGYLKKKRLFGQNPFFFRNIVFVDWVALFSSFRFYGYIQIKYDISGITDQALKQLY